MYVPCFIVAPGGPWQEVHGYLKIKARTLAAARRHTLTSTARSGIPRPRTSTSGRTLTDGGPERPKTATRPSAFQLASNFVATPIDARDRFSRRSHSTQERESASSGLTQSLMCPLYYNAMWDPEPVLTSLMKEAIRNLRPKKFPSPLENTDTGSLTARPWTSGTTGSESLRHSSSVNTASSGFPDLARSEELEVAALPDYPIREKHGTSRSSSFGARSIGHSSLEPPPSPKQESAQWFQGHSADDPLASHGDGVFASEHKEGGLEEDSALLHTLDSVDPQTGISVSSMYLDGY